MRLPVALFALLVAACVSETDDASVDTPALTTTPVHFALRHDSPQPVTYAALTPAEQDAFDDAFKAVGRGPVAAEVRCVAGGYCDDGGCKSWAICAGGGKVARTECTSAGCTTTVH
jgi:hypothetical protein